MSEYKIGDVLYQWPDRRYVIDNIYTYVNTTIDPIYILVDRSLNLSFPINDITSYKKTEQEALTFYLNKLLDRQTALNKEALEISKEVEQIKTYQNEPGLLMDDKEKLEKEYTMLQNKVDDLNDNLYYYQEHLEQTKGALSETYKKLQALTKKLKSLNNK